MMVRGFKYLEVSCRTLLEMILPVEGSSDMIEPDYYCRTTLDSTL